MLAVRTGLAAEVLAVFVVLASLSATVELGPLAWAAALGCGAVTSVAVARGLARHEAQGLGPADVVTLARAGLGSVLAALVVESFRGERVALPLVTVAVTALVLDAVDGLVARRTGTASSFGARFDGEVDAFVILVLSVYVARSAGLWVLMIGLARYLYGVAGWSLPWLTQQLPFRYWRKVVAAVQGVVLTVAAADVAPRAVSTAALVVALALLAESFGRDTLWSARHRRPAPTVGRIAERPQVPTP